MHSRVPSIALVTLHAGYHHSSLALRCLAAQCKGERFYPGIRLFEPTVKADPTAVAAAVAADQPALVGLSCYLWNIEACLAIAAHLRRRLPDTVIVAGGPEAGPRAEELLRDHPALDYVIDGEGEEGFRALARWVLEGDGASAAIPGLARRVADGVRRNPIAATPAQALASPLLEGWLDAGKPLVYWETARGCPFRCSFCTSAGERLRLLPAERIEAELALLRRLEHKTVKLLDRSFHVGSKRTLGLLTRFLDSPASLRFHLELNPDRISPEAMALFAAAPPGKFQFEIGLQTLAPEVLARIHRQMDVPKGLAAIRELVAMRRHPVHLDLIVGLPDEDGARCRESLDTVFALGADHLQLGTLKLLPGTPLRAQAAAFGYRFDPQPPYRVESHRRLSAAEFRTFERYGELLERLWNSGRLRHTLTYAVEHLFEGRVSALFDALLAAAPALGRERPPPEQTFTELARFLPLARDTTLRELFAWEYGHFALPGKAAPPAVHAALAWQALSVDGRPKRLPVYRLGEEAVAIINRRALEPLAPGRYALWPRKHRKGRPVARIPVGGTG